jgi:hypothetical protein
MLQRWSHPKTLRPDPGFGAGRFSRLVHVAALAVQRGRFWMGTPRPGRQRWSSPLRAGLVKAVDCRWANRPRQRRRTVRSVVIQRAAQGVLGAPGRGPDQGLQKPGPEERAIAGRTGSTRPPGLRARSISTWPGGSRSPSIRGVKRFHFDDHDQLRRKPACVLPRTVWVAPVSGPGADDPRAMLIDAARSWACRPRKKPGHRLVDNGVRNDMPAVKLVVDRVITGLFENLRQAASAALNRQNSVAAAVRDEDARPIILA